MKPRALFTSAILVTVSACAPAPSPLPAEMQAEFRPGMTLDDASKRLTARGTTFSVKTEAECQALVERSPNISQLRPRGGPCVFGKIPLSKTWFGGHTDLILQLVFTPGNTLADAHFEEIGSLL
ncbi:hypothetical protein [Zoogloea sp.]|uniref:hypothetical protein n=1 Tax=Zoogloea sp. TaxID=49181 RepID=UPI002BFC705E|nr:hypothetical protein [Zoogloea sp.]